ncbi:hypothetical protein AB0H63_26905 [Micromonospora echinospora]|uniref:hypothetical protein n=1 Tax=Micromonospora echinospora TaxID=1877 RepID=UPI0033CCD6BA
MNLRYTRSEGLRAMGGFSLGVGLLISLLNLGTNPQPGGLVLAGLLVLTGLGLRLEAAIVEPRDQRRPDLPLDR